MHRNGLNEYVILRQLSARHGMFSLNILWAERIESTTHWQECDSHQHFFAQTMANNLHYSFLSIASSLAKGACCSSMANGLQLNIFIQSKISSSYMQFLAFLIEPNLHQSIRVSEFPLFPLRQATSNEKFFRPIQPTVVMRFVCDKHDAMASTECHSVFSAHTHRTSHPLTDRLSSARDWND